MDISSVESQQSKVSAHESSVELPLSLVVFPDVSITPDSGLGRSFSYLLSLYIMPSVPAIPLSKPYASSAGASSAAASSAISSAEPAVAAFCIIENSGAAVSLPAISAADADESAIAPEDIITLEALSEGTRFTAAMVIAAHAATAPPMHAIRRSGSGFLGSSSG